MLFRKKPSEAHWIIGRRIKALIDAGAGDFDACGEVCAQLQSEGQRLTRHDVKMIGQVLDQIIIKPALENYWYSMIAGNCAPILGAVGTVTEPQSWLSKYWLIPAGFVGLIIIRGKRK